jgi:hypothetical protein
MEAWLQTGIFTVQPESPQNRLILRAFRLLYYKISVFSRNTQFCFSVKPAFVLQLIVQFSICVHGTNEPSGLRKST